MSKHDTSIFLAFIILMSILFVGRVHAADVSVHIDEKEVVSALVSQGLTQLNQAKELIFKYMPKDIWDTTWALGERLFTLTQNFLVAAISFVVQVVHPPDKL